MLQEREIAYRYREYTDEPLSVEELRDVLAKLGLSPREVLRTRDPAYRQLSLTGEEPAEELVRAMSLHPTLLQRPIGVLGERAVIGRPIENLVALHDGARSL